MGIQSKEPYSSINVGARQRHMGCGLHWCSNSSDHSLMMKDRVKCIIFHIMTFWVHQHDIILLPHCPNNECPAPCQSASCAETALLHCHPFKVQSRTKCENERVVQISRLWWNCAVCCSFISLTDCVASGWTLTLMLTFQLWKLESLAYLPHPPGYTPTSPS